MAQSRGLDPPTSPPLTLPLPSLLFLLLLFFLMGGSVPGAAVVIPEDYDLRELPQPPELLEEPLEQLVVFPSDDVVLKCLARGNPPVQYSWTRDSQPFDPQEQAGVSQPPGLGGGSLVIEASAAAGLQGRFRCHASSPLGTALSRQSTVIAENTPQWPKEKVTPVEVEEGDPVVLPCDPPKSAVPPKIYWLNSRIVHIAQDARVSQGQDGFLYFAHAVGADSHPDYICHAHYLGPRTIIQKEPLDLRIAPSNSVQSRPPRLLVPKGPQPPLIALRGGSLVLECIAEGLPTPWVSWRRLGGGSLPEGAQLENFNKTLRLREVQDGDGGDYQCEASNQLGSTRHTHHVTVQAAPYWEQQPQSGVYGPGESARLDCGVGGLPPPSISWRINGLPVEEAGGPWGAQVVHGGGSLLLPQLQPNHSLVAQCEAQNPHGRLLANAFVLVLELPVQILSPPQELLEVLENGTALLPCRAFGTPTPTIEWLTPRQEPALLDERSFVFTNGSLRLSAVGRGDAGSYTCRAGNRHSNDSALVVLHVRAPTRIAVPPRNITAKKGETVTFRCPVTFDPALASRGHLEWLWDGKVLSETPDSNRISLSGDSLMLVGVDYGDQGGFVCRARTPLDSVEAEAWLRVVGRPGPVRDLQLLEQGERQIRLSWTPGDDHNSPIEKFVVEEEEGFFSPGTFVERLTVPGGQPWADLDLSPHGHYRFRVLAANAYGRGEPSAPSAPITTPPAAPERNPDGVRGEGNETNNLVIDWEPLPPRAWNGPWLQYRVQWRQPGGGPWQERTVGSPPLVVADTPTFVPFEIRVQALNGAGKGPEPRSILGHSGEDLPLVHPENVRVQPDNSSVRVVWSLEGTRQDLRGHLRGFRILYWCDGWVGEQPASPGHQLSSAAPPGELLVPGGVREALLEGLQPWSRYRLQLAVVNGRGDGPPSTQVPFETLEGVPGPPEELRVQRVNDTTLSLYWGPPRHPNGVLTGFLLHYQRDPSESDGGSQEPPQELWLPPQSRELLLGRLEPAGSYQLDLRGVTGPGQGPALRRIGRLRPEPVLPVLGSVLVGEVGEDFMVLRWTLAHPQPPRQFDVQYMSKTTSEPWQPSGRANSSLGLFRLGGLQPGTPYRVQFVGTNHSGERVVLWESEVHTNGTLLPTPMGGFATEGWFIGFVSAVVLLLLLLLILCFVRRSKGGKYSVKDKEDTQVDSEARPMKDETFGEYRSLESDGEEKVSGSSGGVPGGPGGALGSDDSLAGYGGSGDVQFNEDGSFIGQYSGHRGSSGPASPSAPPPLD